MTTEEKEEFERLLTAVVNAAFDCGECSGVSPKAYEKVLAKSTAAKQALRSFVENLKP